MKLNFFDFYIDPLNWLKPVRTGCVMVGMLVSVSSVGLRLDRVKPMTIKFVFVASRLRSIKEK
jgi:hypothetical protein